MVCLRSWEIHPLLAQGPSAAPALAGAGAVSGCTSKRCWPKTPKISVPGRKLTLDPRFPMWDGSVLRHSQVGGCRQLPLGDDAFQRIDTAALHTCPGLHSAPATPALRPLSHHCLFGQVR